MPEMPEVETIRKTINTKIAGRTIKNIDILLPRLIKYPEPEKYKKMLIGQKIIAMQRRGKYLIMKMSNAAEAVFHLRMTGRLCYSSNDINEDKYKRVIFELDNGDKFIYADTRTLGTLHCINKDEISKIKGLYELGSEPLSTEFTLEYLEKKLQNNNSKIKSFLLNQKNIAGLGNIYVDEALFIAGIYPEIKANMVPADKIIKLYNAVNKVIADGIRDGGTTFRDYVDGDGKKGQHQNNLFVYGREKEKCRKCGTIIKKIKVAGRGTCFCPKCQKP